MGQALTRDQVVALAPDAASAKAAQGLMSDGKWTTLGADAAAVWGECQGSVAKPYQAQVDLSALVARCSCPSRKFPCKHGLALLLLYAQGNPRFTDAARPAWVDEWLQSRQDKAAKKVQAVEDATARAAADPGAAAAANAKREATRWKRIETGTAELERWIADQFRSGLAQFGRKQRTDGEAMAARMVDAQAPGLAPRLHEALAAMTAGMARAPEAIERLGVLLLLAEGVRRRAQLAPARLADVRAALGWPVEKEDVLRDGEPVTDTWRVLGQCTRELDGRLAERRVWLRGVGTHRDALLQEFAHGGQGWETAWQGGRCHTATLRYFPGSVPLRALAVDAAPEASTPAWPVEGAGAAIDRASHAFAANPWLAQVPMLLVDATLSQHDGGWRLHTDVGAFPLRIGDDDAWALLACSGGHPVRAMGEWNGRTLRLLSAWDRDGAHWCAKAAA
jgi:hypothetical protein